MDAPKNTMVKQVEDFLLSARKLEAALAEEKKRSQKIAQEYLSTRTILENSVRDLQNRLIQSENALQATTAAVENLRNENQELATREKSQLSELTNYKNAWGNVLAREAQARNAVISAEKSKAIITELQKKNAALEHALADTRRASSENAKHVEVLKNELQTVSTRIRTAEMRVVQVLNEAEKEKIRLKTDLDKNFNIERERLREAFRNQMRSELERLTRPEREARQAAENEIKLRQTRIDEIEVRRKQENERAAARIEDLSTRIANFRISADQAESEIESLKREVALRQFEANKTKTQFEMAKKESNKSILIQKIRQEEEVRLLKMKIESLLENGVYAEKLETIESGIDIYTADPVAQIPSYSEAMENSTELLSSERN
jgi:hypothetical protein